MRRLALVLLLLAATPAFGGAPLPIREARRQLEAGRLDELYLAYAALEPGAHPEGDAAATAVLVDAARAALDKDDAPIALGLAETARRLQPRSVPAALIFAEAALKLEQPGAAAEALEAALREAPKDGEVLFRRGELARAEGDLERARVLFRAVPERHARRAEARKAAAEVDAKLAAREEELARVAAIEKRFRQQQVRAGERAGEAGTPHRGRAGGTAGGRGPGGGGDTGGGVDPVALGRTTVEDPGVAGMAARRSDHFRILYVRGDRDFAQKANYEGKVLGMLEQIYDKVGRAVGHRPDRTFDVVLYTAEEFALHFGGRFAGGVAGFYQGKIRMNHSEKLDDRFFRVLVHEYTHGVVDDLARGRRVPTWLNEGLAEWTEWEVGGDGDRQVASLPLLRSPRSQGRRIPLSALEDTSFGSMGYATPAYMKSRAAVQALVGTGGGMAEIREVLQALGEGRDFRSAFAEAFGDDRLAELDEEANRLLAR